MCCGKMIRLPNKEERAMITTRQINVKLAKRKKELSRVTTREVDANIRFKKPTGKPAKKPIVTTNKLSDVSDIGEKARRDRIMVEKKLYLEEQKKIAMAKKKPEITLEEIAEKAGATIDSRNIPIEHKKKKKAWKDMTDEEKKDAYKERAKKAKATREAKKKEKAKK